MHSVNAEIQVILQMAIYFYWIIYILKFKGFKEVFLAWIVLTL